MDRNVGTFTDSGTADSTFTAGTVNLVVGAEVANWKSAFNNQVPVTCLL